MLNPPRILSKLLIIFILGLSTLFIADQWVMPWYTNYNEGITVPDVTKLPMDEAEKLLSSYGLRHVVIDTRPHEAFPPNYIIDQSPLGSSIVKPNRKVYLTISTVDRPVVTVPDVTNLSLNNAQIQLQNHGLRDGSITYESSRFRSAVLRQSIPGGTVVERGSIVDLVVSDGLGQRRVGIPQIVGMRLQDGQRLLRESGLRIGVIQFRPTNQIDPNHILSFTPADRDTVFEGETINLIVSEQLSVREETESGTLLEGSSSVVESLPSDTLRPPPINNP
jgi:beta-lactam-binding protein with PASTA domain